MQQPFGEIPILYQDSRVIVCLKPAGVCSTDEPGGLPELLRNQLGGSNPCIRTVHRLDQVVGGVMVLARSREAARRLSDQVAGHRFEKEYLAVIEGCPDSDTATWRDLLTRDKAMRKTQICTTLGKDTREAILHYRVMQRNRTHTLVQIHLETGRTHQIRAQFSGHGYPLSGDKKYGATDGDSVALWSHTIGFFHPQTEEWMRFSALPPAKAPWSEFSMEALQ